jgi:hypothetical protein
MFDDAPRVHACSMVKRVVSSVLWFLAAGWAFNYLSLITGGPMIIGPLMGIAVAAFVGADPLHLCWPVSATASAAPARDAIAAAEAQPQA